MPSMDNILAGAYRKLLADPEITSLIGTDIGKDAAGEAFETGWLFRTTDSEGNPLREVRNSGTSAITISLRHAAGVASPYNSLRVRYLDVYIRSDRTRVTDTLLTQSYDADIRCDRVAAAVEHALNDIGNQDHWWPNGAYIISCVLWNALNINDLADSDGTVEGDMTFILELG